jgi:hypothetical protein
MDRNGLKSWAPLPAIIAVSSALGSPRSSLETDPFRPSAEAQPNARVKSAVQLVSQVAPSSVEKACSQRALAALMSRQR